MAVFRGTDRIRNAITAIKTSFRRVRSQHLKESAGVTNPSQPALINVIRHHRIPIIVTAAGIIALIAVAIGGNKYVEANSVQYYEVFLNGTSVGEISSQEKVETLIRQTEVRLAKADAPVVEELEDYEVAYTAERAFKKVTDDEATLTRLSGMLKTHPIGVKVVVEGQLVGIVRDQKTADELLQKVKNKYVPPSLLKKNDREVKAMSLSTTAVAEEAKPQHTVTSVTFVEKVSTVKTDIDASELSDPDELFQKLTEGEPIPRKYTVQKGDCIGCIATKLGISEELIYQNNAWIENDKIKVGDELDLSESEPPILNVQSVEQVTEIETIDPPIEYRNNDEMKLGKTKVLREGTEGQQQVTYRLIKKNGALIEEEQIAQKVLKAPTPTIILKGTKIIRGEGTGKFSWPVSGARITSYQGARWGRQHKGIDMIGKSNIMAADNGVIEFAGYKSGGLGNAIIINHNNGFKTVYGHMKSVKVKKGQIVEKGEVIGIMGSTGRSTGTHLHFEVYLDGKLKNPTSYL